MRPIRFLIPVLVLATALLVALVKPLPSRAGEASADHTGKLTRKQSRKSRRVSILPRKPTLGHRVVYYARRFIGTPYTWGGTSPRSGFDCSGFVRYVYAHFGVSLPHSTWGDLWRGRRVSRAGLRPGDLVFFDGGGHVGIYVGGGRLIDAPHSGAVVRVSTMNWYGALYGARRVAHGA